MRGILGLGMTIAVLASCGAGPEQPTPATGTNSGTPSGVPTGFSDTTWDLSSEASLAQAIYGLEIPATLPKLVSRWGGTGYEPACLVVADEGSDNFIFDATGCTDGTIGGTLRVEGIQQGPRGFEFVGAPSTITANGFFFNSWSYEFVRIDGTQEVTGTGSEHTATASLTAEIDASATPNLIAGSPSWQSGTYRFTDWRHTLFLSNEAEALEAEGSMGFEDWGTAQVTFAYSLAGEPCALGEGHYRSGSATFNGVGVASVSWDGSTACDGCMPYTLEGGTAGQFCD